ncbi:MAG TPA: hypothetical protein PLD59_15180 [Tepidisphaeraceae bacterium]|nr:hypothetical protein [Tepidisphaeraceae bacterium]
MRWTVAILISLVSVASLTAGCKTTRAGSLAAVQPSSEAPRAGNAYLLRGFIGVFSEGIDTLTAKLNEAGVRAHVYQDSQWASLAQTIRERYRAEKNHEPIILIGHSYGADDVIRIARRLNEDKIEVALLITLDPVTPPKVPGNVKMCVNLYQSNGAVDALPWLRGIAVRPDDPAPTRLVNADIRKDRTDLLESGTGHFNIEKKQKIHSEVVKQVLAICPPRATWLAQNASKGTIYAAAPVAADDSDDTAAAASTPITASVGGGDTRQPN